MHYSNFLYFQFCIGAMQSTAANCIWEQACENFSMNRSWFTSCVEHLMVPELQSLISVNKEYAFLPGVLYSNDSTKKTDIFQIEVLAKMCFYLKLIYSTNTMINTTSFVVWTPS